MEKVRHMGKVNRPRISCAMMAGTAALAIATIANAQDTASFGDIVVTAQKRSENINKVPISISVLTPAQLESSGVSSTQKLEVSTPGLVFGNTNGFAQPYIRGVGTDLILPGQESPVGFYLDGVYLPFTAALIQEFSDIERVEVLKGPQGTLYGRNTTAGAVNIITREPEQELFADVQGSVGTRGQVKLKGYVTGGLADGVSASLSGIIARHDGFFRILGDNTRSDAQQDAGVRAKLKFTPADNLEIVLSGDYLYKHDTTAVAFTNLFTGSAIPPGTPTSSAPRTTYTDGRPAARRHQDSWGLNATIRLDLGSAMLTSITGYRDDLLRSSADGDGTELPLLTFDVVDRSKSFSQELQLVSSNDGPFTWLTGAYFLKGKAAVDPLFLWDQIPNSADPNTMIGGKSDIRNFSFYGQASLELFDGFSVIGGLRYSNERRMLRATWMELPSGTPGDYDLFDFMIPEVRAAFGLDPLRKSVTSDSLDPKITLQYEADGQFLYGTYSRGFKAGAYNLASPDVGPLEPEKMESFEIGGKHRLTESGIQFNWSAFRYKYENLQVSVVDESTGGQTATRNAAATKGKGIDFDLYLPAGDNVRLRLGGAYLDVKYDSFPAASVVDLIDGVINAASGGFVSRDVTGFRGVRSPKFTFTAEGVFTAPLPSGRIEATPVVSYNSGYYFDPGNLIRQDRYALVNLSIMYHRDDDKLGFGIFANNLTDQAVVQGISPTVYRIGAGYNDPRIFGLTGYIRM